jgi:hypothetical protein
MSYSEDILSELRQEKDSKVKQRLGILDQLALVDTEIDKYNTLINNMDNGAIPYFDTINSAITPVKNAYDARINANCRSKLKWVKVDERDSYVFSQGGLGGFQTFQTWECQLDEDEYDFVGYHGAKYYQKPLNRDYGAAIQGSFVGFSSDGSNIIGVAASSSLPSTIQIGDTITDSLTDPSVFIAGDLPEIVGFGTTTAVGFVTTLVGGISTGSNVFAHFGAGISTIGLSVGMILTYTGGLTTDAILPTNTTIVGFGTTNYILEYINNSGILTTSTFPCPSLILSASAINGVEEGVFTVGIITSYQSLLLSTSALADSTDQIFTAIRISADIDASFDPYANPNEPLTIGSLGSGSVGAGGSLFYTESGDSNNTRTYRPSETYINPVNDRVVNPEPRVGAGRADYYVGSTRWPIVTTCTSSTVGSQVITSCSTSYATLGQRVIVGGTNGSGIGYASTGPGGINPNGSTCNSLTAAISAAESTMNSVISTNESSARSIISNTASLRDKRDQKQLYAWSLLQAASSLRLEIAKLNDQIQQLENFDFSPYE